MTPEAVVGLVLGVLSIIAILLGGLGWFIKQKIREFTYQKKVDALTDDVSMLKRAVLQLESDVEELM